MILDVKEAHVYAASVQLIACVLLRLHAAVGYQSADVYGWNICERRD